MANFDEMTISAVWDKAERAGQQNEANGFRKDSCGAWIKRAEYGNRNSKFGWEIDHITPVSRRGSDNLSNLRPLHWQNNASRSDGTLSCSVKAVGDRNVGL